MQDVIVGEDVIEDVSVATAPALLVEAAHERHVLFRRGRRARRRFLSGDARGEEPWSQGKDSERYGRERGIPAWHDTSRELESPGRPVAARSLHLTGSS